MLLPKAASVTGKCCSASIYVIPVFGLSKNVSVNFSYEMTIE